MQQRHAHRNNGKVGREGAGLHNNINEGINLINCAALRVHGLAGTLSSGLGVAGGWSPRRPSLPPALPATAVATQAWPRAPLWSSWAPWAPVNWAFWVFWTPVNQDVRGKAGEVGCPRRAWPRPWALHRDPTALVGCRQPLSPPPGWWLVLQIGIGLGLCGSAHRRPPLFPFLG